ncbi:tyrosine-type recombinase/integrase [Deinococcus irradiatisoli]|uniref:tyrosine-type recombinase/integrase n=1 Tax=Deinococcus irradiatisoli TaxID=2202254 RepID=UPI0015E84856
MTHGDLAAFLLLTGMWRGEAVELKWDAVDFGRGIATVRATRSISGKRVYEGTPKTKQSRRGVPLTSEALALLRHVQAINIERHAALYAHASAFPYVFPKMCLRSLRGHCWPSGTPSSGS